MITLKILLFLAVPAYVWHLHQRLRKSDLKIANAENEWTQAMDSLDYPMYLVDLEDKLVRANKAFYRNVNRPTEDCVGTDIRRLIHLKGEDEPCPGCRARLERRDAFFTKEADDPHNALGRPIEVTIKVIRNEAGTPIGVVQSIRDISHLRDTEQALRKSQALLNKAQQIGHMGNWEWSFDTNDVKWSDETFRIFGYEPNTFTPTYENVLQLVHPDDKEAVQSALKNARDNVSEYQVDHRILLTDGTQRVVSQRGQIACNMDGTPISLVSVCQDITDAHRANEELRKHRNNLEELVSQRTSDLAKARDEAQQASRAKSAFLANMSHELRTPLNAIIGYSEYLFEDLDTLDEESLKKDLKKIVQSGRYLLTLISDILDLSKIEADKLELQVESIDIEKLVSSMAITVDPIIQKNNNTFSLCVESNIGTMHGDVIRIRQALLNLINNAAKFTHNGAIELNIRSTTITKMEWIEFEVLDSGIGMSEEQLENLFQPFWQGQTASISSYGGTGLGLAISQRLCHKMGGDINISSTLHVGSAFTMRIPRDLHTTKTGEDIKTLTADIAS